VVLLQQKTGQHQAVIVFFCGGVVDKKKMTTSVTLFDGFVIKNGNGNYHRLF